MNRELNLPAWGPYSRHYMGISRIVADGAQRQMIDFVLVPGTMRGKIVIPDVNYDCGYHPWTSTPDFSYYVIRYDLQDKDTEYCQAEYYVTEKGCVIKANFVNRSTADKEYAATCFAVQRLHERAKVNLVPQERWIGAEDYETLDFAPPEEVLGKGENYETFCHLNYLRMGHDGLRRGVTVEEDLVDAAGLGNRAAAASMDDLAIARNKTFLMNPGTCIAWNIDCPARGYVYLRYAMAGIETIQLAVSCGMEESNVVLRGGAGARGAAPGSRTVSTLPARAILGRRGKKAFLMDGFLLTEEEDSQALAAKFVQTRQQPRFQIHRHPGKKGVALITERLPEVTVAMYSEQERALPPAPYSDCSVTNVYHGELSGARVLRKLNNDSLLNWGSHNCQIDGDGKNHFAGYHAAPIVCRAGETQTVYMALVCTEAHASPEEAIECARALIAQSASIEHVAREAYQRWMEKQRGRVWANDYAFGQERLMCNLLTNVTFPVYIKDGFYRTYTPGKRWGGLFTWDSGMLGIGLAEYAPDHAGEILTQYFPDAEDAEIDAVLHGTQLHQYYTEIITGKLSVDAFDEFVQAWYANGGEQLTKEANEWYASVK